ncbi:MAG: hypothetical protein GY834_11145 [Bacteroidetes bacterium]|nr:hypothetical protein [Bacteroidota bacterium]
MERIVRAFAPASIANVSYGFDALELAIYSLGDILEVSSIYRNTIEIMKLLMAKSFLTKRIKVVVGLSKKCFSAILWH